MLLAIMSSSLMAAPVSDAHHSYGNRYFVPVVQQPYYYHPEPAQQRWNFMPSGPSTRLFGPCPPCTRDASEAQRLNFGASGSSSTNNGMIFDLNQWLTNPLGMFWPPSSQQPNVWPWPLPFRPCCVEPTTTTAKPSKIKRVSMMR